MKQVRLLPIVIAAGAALLLLKGFGIMTGGGYVLTGPTAAIASGGGGGSAEGGNATLALPVEPTLMDESPTIDDGAPTLPMAGPAEHGEIETEHGGDGETAAETPAHETEMPEGAHAVPEDSAMADPAGDDEETASETACPEDRSARSVAFSNPDGGCMPPVDAYGDAIPMVRGDDGNPVSLDVADGAVGSENSVLERLADRREELDTRESELDMRLALVEAAERRITERTAALEMLEARINAMVDEKRVLEEAQFTALVSMYETMKPKDAAAIFDELEADVLLRVARAVNPRKMGPIMAKMDPLKARDLTSGLAVDRVEPTIDLSGETLASLPQIIGQ